MIPPYGVVGVIPTVWGIQKREDISKNLDHMEELASGALGIAGLDLPVRLLVFPEGAMQGFTDEVFDQEMKRYAHECAIDIPGPETDRIGRFAKKHNVFIMAQAKARHPDWPDLFFNIGFVINPKGEIILKHHKISALLPTERSVSPHDVYDWWVEKYGRNLQSFWPVADTEIGRLGVMMAMEGNYPENGRGLMMNGAEVVYRASLPTAFTENDVFEISNRARALENNFYVLAPNIGGAYYTPNSRAAVDNGGGQSMIVDYKGRIVGRQRDTNGSTYVQGVIDIEALRYHRLHAQVNNWAKDIRAELAQIVYEQPIYPKNLYLHNQPEQNAGYKKHVIDKQVEFMRARGIWRSSIYDNPEEMA